MKSTAKTPDFERDRRKDLREQESLDELENSLLTYIAKLESQQTQGELFKVTQ